MSAVESFDQSGEGEQGTEGHQGKDGQVDDHGVWSL